jgi:hypothetical protein
MILYCNSTNKFKLRKLSGFVGVDMIDASVNVAVYDMDGALVGGDSMPKAMPYLLSAASDGRGDGYYAALNLNLTAGVKYRVVITATATSGESREFAEIATAINGAN